MSLQRLSRSLATAVTLAMAAAPVSTIGAQSILLRTGTAGGRIQVPPGATVGIPVVIDMGAAAGANLASLTTGMDFGPARLTLDSVRSGAFGALTVNSTSAASGSIILGIFDARGTTATTGIGTAWFTTSASTGGTTIAFSPTVAGSDLGANILAQLRVRNLDVCVAPSGRWGDVTGDSAVNIIDAQQIARATVGLGVLDAALVAAQGDVNADGTVNIIDAQQIARFSVGLSAAALINTARFIPPAIVSLTLSGVPTGVVPVGGSATLVATPKDAAAVAQNGCVPTTWASSNPAIATVDSGGGVVGVANGTVTITATAGGNSRTATVTIFAPVATVTISPSSATLAVGGTTTLAATLKDAVGTVLTGRIIAWSSTNPTVATVSATGIVSGVAAGSATITATSEGKSATAAATVAATPAQIVPQTISAGGYHTCGLTTSGAAYCWGENWAGQLGDGTTTDRSTPVAVSGGVSFASINSGSTHTCALTASGAAYCWGDNSKAQLGDGTTTNRSTPVGVSGGVSFAGISSGGGTHTCGVTASAAGFCWGYNAYGQLGDGTTTTRSAPVAVSGGVSFATINTGYAHTCGLTATGATYCWGHNGYGQLGDGTTINHGTPVAVSSGVSFAGIIGGIFHTCGLTAAGITYCWGSNSFGQLGDATTTSRSTPVAVSGGITFATISTSAYHTCGLTASGTSYCWGNNDHSQLGDGTTVLRSTPVAISPGVSFARISSGGIFHTCALTASGSASCWGYNYYGQLGDGTTVNHSTPMAVLGGVVFKP